MKFKVNLKEKMEAANFHSKPKKCQKSWSSQTSWLFRHLNMDKSFLHINSVVTSVNTAAHVAGDKAGNVTNTPQTPPTPPPPPPLVQKPQILFLTLSFLFHTNVMFRFITFGCVQRFLHHYYNAHYEWRKYWVNSENVLHVINSNNGLKHEFPADYSFFY